VHGFGLTSARAPRRGFDFSKQVLEKGWYHSFELPDGTVIDGCVSLELQHQRWGRFPIPEDLGGKRVLDIGAWDGWFSFEAERRGGAVVAIDCVEIQNFIDLHRRLRSKVDYRIVDFYDLPSAALGTFDITFFLGVLYHLKHPFLALEIVCALTTDVAIIESFVIDGETWQEHKDDIPVMEFYESDELGGQLDNWNGPTVACVMAMCRSAGFARVELMYAGENLAGVACYRKWEPVRNPPAAAPPELMAVENSRTFGLNFSSRGDEYVTCRFGTTRDLLRREELRLEIDEVGVPCMYLKPEGVNTWVANFRLPPGLAKGWKTVRLRFADSGFGKTLRIAIDMPVRSEEMELKAVCDGKTWTPAEVTVAERGYLACWVRGLPENADRHNVRVWLEERRLMVDWVGEPEPGGLRQVNAIVSADARRAKQKLRVECGGQSCDSVVTVVG
jgi:tRNA (mo5U34)-methyltransferase